MNMVTRQPYWPISMDKYKLHSHESESRQDHTEDVFHSLQSGPEKKMTINPRPNAYKKRMWGPLRDLGLPKACQSATSLDNTLVVRHESPWDTFTKEYECDLAGILQVASTVVRPTRLVAIKTVKGEEIQRRLRLLEYLQHPNVLSSQECYLHDDSLFILYHSVQASLDNLVACEAYLNEIQVAAALAQVSFKILVQMCLASMLTMVSEILDGLLYLTCQKLEHLCLTSSNILLTGKGEVKIGMCCSLST